MRQKSVFLILAISLFVSSIAHAEEVCFSEADAEAIVVDIEKGKNLAEQVDLYKQANAELAQQVKLLKEIGDLQKQQLEVSRTAIEQYKDIIKYQGEAFQQVLKEAKPSILKCLIDAVGFIGIGALVGILVL
ncbi:MAG: hypothetical protein M0Z71_04740 [Nitrospiraceae bacterium]|nr:hypothetical protein [Nitrospiraceae bacterium]